MSEFRPIRPLGTAGLVPAVLMRRPDLRWIAVEALAIDPAYQRSLSERSVKLIRQIVAEWDWRRVKALNVLEHPGGVFEVVDGQHTAIAAATHGAIAELPCLVAGASMAEAAALDFVALNSMRLGVTPAQRFWASVAAGDPVAGRIAAAAETVGVRLLRAPPASGRYLPGDTVAFSALRKWAEKIGQAELARLLGGLRNAGLAPVKSLHVAAVGRLLWSSEYAGDVPGARIVEILRRDAAEIEAAAREARAEAGGSLAGHFAAELYRRAF